ncbi:hypothetical protein [Pedobacter miscanthi]|jgi:hypothetical protein|uniref:hypothetical protein n=1 Tax=Pedobacter miscanthi TaxID=2259170 RepID=UPI00292FA47B|nr:hypothetical protein [Pedobacter miscanthi]
MINQFKNLLEKISALSDDKQLELYTSIKPILAYKDILGDGEKSENPKLKRMAGYGAYVKDITGNYTHALLVKSDNGNLAIDAEDCVVGYNLRNNEKYGASEIQDIRKYLNGDSNVMILGAHIGTLGIPYQDFAVK